MKKMRSRSSQREGGAPAGAHLEVAEREVADDEVDHAEPEADGDRESRVTAERGLAHPADAPGRREHLGDRRVQPGRSERATSRPVTSQTGYSRRFDSEFALRRSTKVDASTSPSRPSARDRPRGGRWRTTRVGEVERQVEDEPAPEQRRGDRVEADRGRRDRHRQEDEDQRASARRSRTRASPASAATG